jgi:hypothetical protein
MSQGFKLSSTLGKVICNSVEVTNNVIQASSDVIISPDQDGTIVLINVNTGVNVTLPLSNQVNPGFSITVYYNCNTAQAANNSRIGVSYSDTNGGYYLYGGIVGNMESGSCAGGIFTTSVVQGDFIKITIVGPAQGFITGVTHTTNAVSYDD